MFILIYNIATIISVPRLSICLIGSQETSAQKTLIMDTIKELSQQSIFSESEIIVLLKSFLDQRDEKNDQEYPNVSIYYVDHLPLGNYLNYAVQKAQAPFMIQIEPGSTHVSSSLEQRLLVLEADPSIDVVYSDYYWSYEPFKNILACSDTTKCIMQEFNSKLFNFAVPGPEPMWRKNIHERFGYFDGGKKPNTMWSFWRKIVAAGATFKRCPILDMVYFIDLEQTRRSDFGNSLINLMETEYYDMKQFLMPCFADIGVQKDIVIIVPSYNNSTWYKKNLFSLLTQNYRNYRIIYIDDASTDDTGMLVQNFLAQTKQTHKVTLVKNEMRKGCPLANIYYALHNLCKPHEIAVIVDGDDWLASENALAYINKIYQDPHVWLTYGQFAIFPFYLIGWAHQVPHEVMESNAIREYQWCTTHLRTFYVHLFQCIEKESFLYKDRFFPMAGDLALMFPLIELAGKHAYFIPDVLYIYNRANALNEDKINRELQYECEKAARASKKYAAI